MCHYGETLHEKQLPITSTVKHSWHSYLDGIHDGRLAAAIGPRDEDNIGSAYDKQMPLQHSSCQMYIKCNQHKTDNVDPARGCAREVHLEVFVAHEVLAVDPGNVACTANAPFQVGLLCWPAVSDLWLKRCRWLQDWRWRRRMWLLWLRVLMPLICLLLLPLPPPSCCRASPAATALWLPRWRLSLLLVDSSQLRCRNCCTCGLR